MRTLAPSEKRTIRYAAIGIVIYLVLFGGYQVWKFFEKRRADYIKMVAEARQLKSDVAPYADQAAVVKKLMEDFHLDPAKLTKNTVVAEATAAMQKAATSGGIQPGPIRESAGQVSNKDLATIQFEGTGTVAAVMSLLQRLPTLGFPLVVDSVQIAAAPTRPGQIKLNVTVRVLDFEQWKKAEAPHA
jgi:hypothetical protein